MNAIYTLTALSQLLSISTSFWVLRAPKSWSKPQTNSTNPTNYLPPLTMNTPIHHISLIIMHSKAIMHGPSSHQDQPTIWPIHNPFTTENKILLLNAWLNPAQAKEDSNFLPLVYRSCHNLFLLSSLLSTDPNKSTSLTFLTPLALPNVKPSFGPIFELELDLPYQGYNSNVGNLSLTI